MKTFNLLLVISLSILLSPSIGEAQEVSKEKLQEWIKATSSDSLLSVAILECEKQNLDSLEAQARFHRSRIYFEQNKLAASAQDLNACIELFKKLGENRWLGKAYLRRAELERFGNNKFVLADSLLQIAYHHLAPIEDAIKEKLSIYRNRSEIVFHFQQYDLCDSLTDLHIKVAEASGEEDFIFEAYRSALINYTNLQKTKKQNTVIDKMIPLLERSPLSIKKAEYIYNLANNFFLNDKYNKAIKMYLKADSLFGALEIRKYQNNINLDISNVYRSISNFEKAYQYAQKALKNMPRKGSWVGRAFYINAISLMELDSTASDQYTAYLDSALYYYQNDNDIRTKVQVYNAMAIAQRKQNNFAAANKMYDKTIALFKNPNDPALNTVYYSKAKTLFMDEKYSSALQIFKKILPSRSTKNDSAYTYRYLTKCYDKLGNKALAYENLKHAQRLRHEQDARTIVLKVEELNEKYQSEKKEIENQNLLALQSEKEKTISNQQKFIAGTTTGVFLTSLLSFLLFRQFSKQKDLNRTLALQKSQIETLNRELNHRVKNNLAFMTSLLEMQARRTDSVETKTLLQESENRIKTLAIVHDNLFNKVKKSEVENTINLKEYLTELIQHLKTIFSLPNKDLQINTQLDNIKLDAEDAVRVGLVVNELITNSVKHAFHQVSNPTIDISLDNSSNQLPTLEYHDNGDFDNPKEQDTNHKPSFGLKLISLLQTQLNDTIQFKI